MDNIFQSPYFRIFVVVFIMMTTFFYSSYERRKIDLMQESSVQGSAVIAHLPEVEFSDWKTNESHKTQAVANSSKGLYVHFWATWCGPCEAEFPAFLEYAKKLEASNVRFLLVAVKDDEVAVKKLLARFKTLPTNVNLVFDLSGNFMGRFGTLKLPETFLFKSNGELLNHYPGPQDWALEGMFNRTLIQLGL